MDEGFLRIALYKLYYIKDLNGFAGLDAQEKQSLKTEYTSDEVASIVNAVTWGVQHPDYDFASLLPDLPYDNSEIHRYLRKLESSLADVK